MNSGEDVFANLSPSAEMRIPLPEEDDSMASYQAMVQSNDGIGEVKLNRTLDESRISPHSSPFSSSSKHSSRLKTIERHNQQDCAQALPSSRELESFLEAIEVSTVVTPRPITCEKDVVSAALVLCELSMQDICVRDQLQENSLSSPFQMVSNDSTASFHRLRVHGRTQCELGTEPEFKSLAMDAPFWISRCNDGGSMTPEEHRSVVVTPTMI